MRGHDRLRFSLTAPLAVLVLLAFPAFASAADTFADPSRPDDAADCLTPATACKTIEFAIGQASAGDVIKVAAGTYPGNPAACPPPQPLFGGLGPALAALLRVSEGVVGAAEEAGGGFIWL